MIIHKAFNSALPACRFLLRSSIMFDYKPIFLFVKVVLNATTISRGIKRTAQETTGGML